jgi:hypothetical protein
VNEGCQIYAPTWGSYFVPVPNQVIDLPVEKPPLILISEKEYPEFVLT